MSERTAALLYPATLAGIAAVLFYAIRSQRQSSAMLRSIRDTTEHDANRSRAIYRLLKKQRRVLHQLSDYLLPGPKGVEKTAS
jgi:hypothetical protein